jgi:hypothetical protein
MALGDLCYKSGGSALCFKSGGNSLVYKGAPECKVICEYTYFYTCKKYKQDHDIFTKWNLTKRNVSGGVTTTSALSEYRNQKTFIFRATSSNASFYIGISATTPCKDKTEKCYYYSLEVYVGNTYVFGIGGSWNTATGATIGCNVFLDEDGYPYKIL